MSISNDQVLEALRPVEDPELHRSIVDLDMVRSIEIGGSAGAHSVTVAVDLTIAGCPLRAEIDRRVREAVMALDGVADVVIEFGVMTDEQREALRRRLHGDPSASAGSQQGHGHAEGRAIPFADPDNRTRVILVASERVAWERAPSPPTCRWLWPIEGDRLPSSTPTCGASRFPGCWASTGTLWSSTR